SFRHATPIAMAGPVDAFISARQRGVAQLVYSPPSSHAMAGDVAAGIDLPPDRLFRKTPVDRLRAAGAEFAAGRRVGRIGYVTLEQDALPAGFDRGIGHRN